jgi:hypothetical protein
MADQDILIGPGRLYRAPLGTANPDESTVAYGASWGGSWTDVGDILEGSPVVLSMSEEFTDVHTEQFVAARNSVRTRREIMIKATLAEHTVANLEMLLSSTAATTAAAGGGQKGFSEIKFGSESAVDMYKWGIEALRVDSAGNNQPVRWFLHRGYIKLAGDVSYAKQNPTGLPVEIKILADATQSSGEELGTLHIVTAAATAT